MDLNRDAPRWALSWTTHAVRAEFNPFKQSQDRAADHSQQEYLKLSGSGIGSNPKIRERIGFLRSKLRHSTWYLFGALTPANQEASRLVA